MAEHTYKSKDLTAVIEWDVTQTTAQDEGMILADISIYAYKPSQLDIHESYIFNHSGVYYTFVIPRETRHQLATKCLLGVNPTLSVRMSYVIAEDRRA